MKNKLRRHISHVAKQSKVPVRDAWDAWANMNCTIKEGVDTIRFRAKCTVKVARKRYDAAMEIVDQVILERSIGKKRRYIAQLSPTETIQERKESAIKQLIGFGHLPGSYYSGDTSWEIEAVPRNKVCAYTNTTEGDEYSRSCWYNKTNATHHLKICLVDLIAARRTSVPRYIDGELVIHAQQIRENIYELKTVTCKGKQIVARHRFAADQGGGQWYLGKTERGAVVALNRAKRQIEAVRLGKINAGVCQDWGWCAQGIKQWCLNHGIKRDLKKRLRQGTKSQAIAKLIEKHGGPKTSYERRLVEVAG
jgi:hypothetical protein